VGVEVQATIDVALSAIKSRRGTRPGRKAILVEVGIDPGKHAASRVDSKFTVRAPIDRTPIC
jgi:hypothetical protein